MLWVVLQVTCLGNFSAVLALTPGDLSACVYAPNLFGQKCCVPGSVNCVPTDCRCPDEWDCENGMCTAPCSSFLLQTNTGNPRDSFTFCESINARQGMPNCYCPDRVDDGSESVCIPDFHNGNMPRKLCSYRKYRVKNRGNRKGLGWKNRPRRGPKSNGGR